MKESFDIQWQWTARGQLDREVARRLIRTLVQNLSKQGYSRSDVISILTQAVIDEVQIAAIVKSKINNDLLIGLVVPSVDTVIPKDDTLWGNESIVHRVSGSNTDINLDFTTGR